MMSEKYPLTEKVVELREPTFVRWQYTLSGWIRLIRTPNDEEGKAMESQICNRMWEDLEFDKKIRKEFEDWLAEDLFEDWRMDVVEDKIRVRKNKSIRIQGKYKGRGKEKKREP